MAATTTQALQRSLAELDEFHVMLQERDSALQRLSLSHQQQQQHLDNSRLLDTRCAQLLPRYPTVASALAALEEKKRMLARCEEKVVASAAVQEHVWQRDDARFQVKQLCEALVKLGQEEQQQQQQDLITAQQQQQPSSQQYEIEARRLTSALERKVAATLPVAAKESAPSWWPALVLVWIVLPIQTWLASVFFPQLQRDKDLVARCRGLYRPASPPPLPSTLEYSALSDSTLRARIHELLLTCDHPPSATNVAFGELIARLQFPDRPSLELAVSRRHIPPPPPAAPPALPPSILLPTLPLVVADLAEHAHLMDNLALARKRLRDVTDVHHQYVAAKQAQQHFASNQGASGTPGQLAIVYDRPLARALSKFDAICKQVDQLARRQHSNNNSEIVFPELVGEAMRVWERANVAAAAAAAADALRNTKTTSLEAELRGLVAGCISPSSSGGGYKAKEDFEWDELPPRMHETLLLRGAQQGSRVRGATLMDADAHRFVFKRYGGGDDAKQEIARLRGALLMRTKSLEPHPCMMCCLGAIVSDDDDDGISNNSLPTVLLRYDYMEGGDLCFWSQEQPRSQFHKINVLTHVADAMLRLHEMHVYHTQICATNVLLTSRENGAMPKLSGFDFAVEVVGGEEEDTALTPSRHRRHTAAEKRARLEQKDVQSFAVMAVALQCGGEEDASALDTLQAHRDHFTTGNAFLQRVYGMLLAACECDTTASKDVFAALAVRKCVVNSLCQNGTALLAEGTTCCTGEHFICALDLAGYVASECNRPVTERAASAGRIKCPEREHGHPAAATAVGWFLDDVLPRSLLTGHVLPSRNALMEHEKQRYALQVAARAVQEDRQLGQVEQLRNQIVEDIFTLRCPNCHRAFVDFSGCLALTCTEVGGCGAHFCALCLHQGNSSQVMHQHVKECAWNPHHGEYHASTEVFAACQRRRKAEALRALLSQLDQNTRRRLKKDPTVAGCAREVGVMI